MQFPVTCEAVNKLREVGGPTFSYTVVKLGSLGYKSMESFQLNRDLKRISRHPVFQPGGRGLNLRPLLG